MSEAQHFARTPAEYSSKGAIYNARVLISVLRVSFIQVLLNTATTRQQIFLVLPPKVSGYIVCKLHVRISCHSYHTTIYVLLQKWKTATVLWKKSMWTTDENYTLHSSILTVNGNICMLCKWKQLRFPPILHHCHAIIINEMLQLQSLKSENVQCELFKSSVVWTPLNSFTAKDWEITTNFTDMMSLKSLLSAQQW